MGIGDWGLGQRLRRAGEVLLAVQRGSQVVLGLERGGVPDHRLAVVDLRLLELSFLEFPVAGPHVMAVRLGGRGQRAGQQQQDGKVSSHSNNLLLGRRSPISISRTKNSSAAAKKYIYCSSYSSKTTELNRSSSSLRISSRMGLSPNSSPPAWT